MENSTICWNNLPDYQQPYTNLCFGSGAEVGTSRRVRGEKIFPSSASLEVHELDGCSKHGHGEDDTANAMIENLYCREGSGYDIDQSVDYKNDNLVWFPPPPENESDEEEDILFSNEDDCGSVLSSSCSPSFFPVKSKQEETKESHRAFIQGHFRALVSQLMQGEGLQSEDWLDIITTLAWQAVKFVKPDTSRGGSMDPGDYVKIKCIASGTPSDSNIVKGVVCTKNVKHKRMVSQFKNPKLLILGGALEYQRVPSQLASFDTLLQQEIDHLKMIVGKIEARKPNVLLVEKSVSSYAQEYLLAKEISLVLNVKRTLLERVARCTGATVTPSSDRIPSAQLGHCEIFRLEKVVEELELQKKSSKTLMFFDSCPRRLGCTVLLKGLCRERLKRVKHVLQYAVFAAYHLLLETSFLADEGASLPKFSSRASLTEKVSMECSPETEDTPSVVEVEEEMHIGEACEPDGNEKIDENEASKYLSAANSQQSILVACSSRSLNGNECERSRIVRIKFYGCFDKPLGRYLCDDLFDQASSCRSCGEPVEAHERSFTHQQGNLTIKVRRLDSLRLPGEREGKIWMWHRCLKCSPTEGIPPATRRGVLSDAAWGLSFGKFLELSFSDNATAKRVADCGHSLQRDCLRFYGAGPMVVLFYYSPIEILSVRLPAPKLEFDGLGQMEWARAEASEVTSQINALYSEVSNVLRSFELKIIDGDHSSTEESHNHTMKLKDLLEAERDDYSLLLHDMDSVDILELNRLRRALLVNSHVWDHRFSLLDSLIRGSLEVPEELRVEEDGKNSDSDDSRESCVLDDSSETAEVNNNYISDTIESAWNGSGHIPAHNCNPAMDLRENSDGVELHFRKSLAPSRVYSFDSVLRIHQSTLRDLSSPSLSSARSFHASDNCWSRLRYGTSGQSAQDAQDLSFILSSTPSYIFSACRGTVGVRLLLPHPAKSGLVIGVYDNEPTSLISYALSTKVHEDWVSQRKRERVWANGGKESGSFHPEATQININDLHTDWRKTTHLKISYGDISSTADGKIRFSIVCYYAKQFDTLRKKCCQRDLDIVRSLSRCKSWKADGGKSKVYFARSLDERFIIKQVTKTELEAFEEFAPGYFKYLIDSLHSGSPTCLAKILGIYQVSMKSVKGGKETKMDLMVMENLFFDRKISKVYDLKGSARARYNPDTTGTNRTLLDMNLMEILRTQPIFLGSKAKRSLERAVWNDTSFLASVDVMDYSLLVGVDEERKELVVGIIDFLRQYTWDKHLETWVKASGILGWPKNVSPTIVSPEQYKRRFRKAMTAYFLTVPQWPS